MFRRNIARARQVWGSLGKFLRREGSDLIFSSKFYRAVVQVVLLFGAETWFLTEEIMHKLEGVHVGFLWQVTGMTDRNLGVNTWQRRGHRVCSRRQVQSLLGNTSR